MYTKETTKLSEFLKKETKGIHQKVEKKVILRIKAIASDADYIDLLNYFYVYFDAVEQAASPFISATVLPDYTNRRNASGLLSDIHELGGVPTTLLTAKPPQIANSLQAMSAYYVLEGSTAGGPHIVDMLRKKGIDKGFSFFLGYGVMADDKWQIFKDHLDSLPQGTEDFSMALETTHRTFEQFGEIFDQ